MYVLKFPFNHTVPTSQAANVQPQAANVQQQYADVQQQYNDTQYYDENAYYDETEGGHARDIPAE